MTTRPLPEKRNEDDTSLNGFDEVPLFMKTLPGDETENIALSALQDLVHEGTEDGGSSLPILIMMISHSSGTEVALNFKEQANEYFKGKRYREALGFYKQGTDAKPKDKSILEALLCNTAACNLELSACCSFVLNGMIFT